MKHHLIMGLVAAGIAFGGGTTAQAANDNHVGWLLQQLHQQQAERQRQDQASNSFTARSERRCLRQRLRNGRWVTYKDQRCLERRRDRVESRTPPRQCLRRKRSRDGWLTYYDNRCLERRGFDTRSRYENRNGTIGVLRRDRDDDD